MDTKKKYAGDLLAIIRELEKRVELSIEKDIFSFSFFRESFDQTEKIMRLLHELENLQVEEMKSQMEKLVLFLSENENRVSASSAKTDETTVSEAPAVEDKMSDNLSEQPVVDANKVEDKSQTSRENFWQNNDKTSLHNKYAEGIIFPQYKKPEMPPPVNVPVEPKIVENKSANTASETPATTSLNDTIKKEPTFLDLRKEISLNDRFLFQRELFNNDGNALNEMMSKLNTFSSFDEAEQYLREHTSWNFEDPVVKDFLFAIKKVLE